MVRGLASNGCAEEQNTVSLCSYNLNIVLWLSPSVSLEQPQDRIQEMGSAPSQLLPMCEFQLVRSCSSRGSPHRFRAPTLVTVLGPSLSLIISSPKHMCCVGSLCGERRCTQDLHNYFRLRCHIANR